MAFIVIVGLSMLSGALIWVWRKSYGLAVGVPCLVFVVLVLLQPVIDPSAPGSSTSALAIPFGLPIVAPAAFLGAYFSRRIAGSSGT